MKRKMIISTATLVAILVAITTVPSLAQTARTRNPAPLVVSPAPMIITPGVRSPVYGAEAFAAVPGAVPFAAQPNNNDCAQDLGWDPDPTIRLQLLRDMCIHQGE